MFDGLSVLVFANIVSCMLVGAASLTAAMSQERTSYRAQAETLQRSEARLARGVRLESMGRMAAGIAHDFNNVLTVIDSSVMLAGDSADPSEARSYLTEARAASARGIGLTRQLLAFAREQPRASERLELAARIESLRPMLGRLAGPAVDIRVGAIPQDAAIRLEPSQFDQILLNLVANARDAMPNGGVVTIDATTRDVAVDTVDSRRFVHLRFSDNGEGMDAATIEHIFEPFFSTKSDGKGSGLGLATVYGIVRQAHGEIAVRSTVGGGAHFEIQLPAA
jgi:signal transduction histidine kinase